MTKRINRYRAEVRRSPHPPECRPQWACLLSEITSLCSHWYPCADTSCSQEISVRFLRRAGSERSFLKWFLPGLLGAQLSWPSSAGHICALSNGGIYKQRKYRQLLQTRADVVRPTDKDQPQGRPHDLIFANPLFFFSPVRYFTSKCSEKRNKWKCSYNIQAWTYCRSRSKRGHAVYR